MTKTMTPAEVASEFGTDGRTVRKFLRSVVAKADQPGKGSRWSIPATKTDLTKLRKAFDAWEAAAKQKAADKAEAAAEVETPEIEEPAED